jgi:hypothetical protein
MIQEEPTIERRPIRPIVPTVGACGRSVADQTEASVSFEARDDGKRWKWAVSAPSALDCFIIFNGGLALLASLWLAASGNWNALGFELLDVVVAPFLFLIFALAMTPAMLVVSARARALSRGRHLAARFWYGGMYVWTALVQSCWCVLCFRSVPHDLSSGLPWPSLLFAYSMAALPIQWLLRGSWEGEAAPVSRLLRRLVRARVRMSLY